MAKPPIHEIRIGRIKACVWENETANGVRHNFTISRLYKENEEWKESSSYGRDDLPLVRLVLDKAYEWSFVRPKDAEAEPDSDQSA